MPLYDFEHVMNNLLGHTTDHSNPTATTPKDHSDSTWDPSTESSLNLELKVASDFDPTSWHHVVMRLKYATYRCQQPSLVILQHKSSSQQMSMLCIAGPQSQNSPGYDVVGTAPFLTKSGESRGVCDLKLLHRVSKLSLRKKYLLYRDLHFMVLRSYKYATQIMNAVCRRSPQFSGRVYARMGCDGVNVRCCNNSVLPCQTSCLVSCTCLPCPFWERQKSIDNSLWPLDCQSATSGQQY